MDILSDSQTCAGIANEWEPCTPELFESTDTLMFNLITDPVNMLPQLAPDGNYCPSNVGIKKITNVTSFQILPNYPNPFNPVTTLHYDLPEDGLVNITIYDMMGRVVSNLVSSQQRAGYKSIQWNATNEQGHPVSAGLYLYTIEAGEFRQTRKMVLLK